MIVGFLIGLGMSLITWWVVSAYYRVALRDSKERETELMEKLASLILAQEMNASKPKITMWD